MRKNVIITLICGGLLILLVLVVVPPLVMGGGLALLYCNHYSKEVSEAEETLAPIYNEVISRYDEITSFNVNYTDMYEIALGCDFESLDLADAIVMLNDIGNAIELSSIKELLISGYIIKLCDDQNQKYIRCIRYGAGIDRLENLPVNITTNIYCDDYSIFADLDRLSVLNVDTAGLTNEQIVDIKIQIEKIPFLSVWETS